MDSACGDQQVAVAAHPTPGKCSKCAAEQGQFPIRGDLLCRGCFLVATEHRFKSTLRTQIPFQRGEKLLVAVSGGASSMCLLHMVAHALDPHRNKRHMNFTVEVVHIDVSAAYSNPGDNSAFLAQLQSYGFPVVVVRLEDLYPAEVRDIRERQDAWAADYLYLLVRKAIISYADSHAIAKVLLGENGSRVAARMLSWICKGRGAALYNESGHMTHVGHTALCRPLRDVLGSEIALYSHLEAVTVFPRLPMTQKFDLPGLGSVEILSETFLQTLQEKFPATTHTVLRTAGKLSKKDDLPVCTLCLCPQDAPLSPLEGTPSATHCYACMQMLSRAKECSGR